MQKIQKNSYYTYTFIALYKVIYLCKNRKNKLKQNLKKVNF